MHAREGVAAAVAKEWGVDAKDIAFASGRLTAKGVDARRPSRRPARARAGGARGHRHAAQGLRRMFAGSNGGCQFAEVTVDVETGVVRVRRSSRCTTPDGSSAP